MPEATLATAVIQGGMGGALVLTLWILYKINGNHLEHLERSNARFAESIDKLSDAILSLRDKIK